MSAIILLRSPLWDRTNAAINRIRSLPRGGVGGGGDDDDDEDDEDDGDDGEDRKERRKRPRRRRESFSSFDSDRKWLTFPPQKRANL